LLSDGRATLRPAWVSEIADEGADDAAFIDPVMFFHGAFRMGGGLDAAFEYGVVEL
jgi:hypothetical protein